MKKGVTVRVEELTSDIFEVYKTNVVTFTIPQKDSPDLKTTIKMVIQV